MRLVALVSGGKDSCFNMLQCIAAGHEIVALANLYPENKGEVDSYMYQSVAVEGIELYSEAMALPLYRQMIRGTAVNQDRDYIPTGQDEVEDLYILLKQIQYEMKIEGVSVGAIMSDYQRVRVENICQRLDLISFGYLWRRDQEELLQEMIESDIKAIVVKVAAMGLNPKQHLGLYIEEIMPHLVKMKEKYQLNVCGEGGEFETFTVDCPLFKKLIQIDEKELVMHSDDAFAPVGYLRFNKLSLVDKPNNMNNSWISQYNVKGPSHYIADLDVLPLSCEEETLIKEQESVRVENSKICDGCSKISTPRKDLLRICVRESNCAWIGSVVGQGKDLASSLDNALSILKTQVESENFTLVDVVVITLYIKDMAMFSTLNGVYKQYFSHVNPPIRACIQVDLPDEKPVLLEAFCVSKAKLNPQFLHVQGISHWAPASIGPYSQAAQVQNVIYVAGMIGLVPGSMLMIEGGIGSQCALSLRHVDRVLQCVDVNVDITCVTLGFCYVTHKCYIGISKREWERRNKKGIMEYIVVPQLPRSALVEWFVWAHKETKDFYYEQSNSSVNTFPVKFQYLRYNSSVAVVLCNIQPCTSCSSDNLAHRMILNDVKPSDEYSVPLNKEPLLTTLNTILSRFPFESSSQSVVVFKVHYMASAICPVGIEEAFNELRTHYRIVPTIIPVTDLEDSVVSIAAVIQDEFC